jgi:GNAT superfamily N-acetyltransferase
MGPDGNRAAGRFERGCRCFALEQKGQIVAYAWLSTSSEWIGELSLSLTPLAGEAYVWNCFTLEPYRRRGYYRGLLNGLVLQASAEGLQRLWIGSVEDPAEKADADAGFAPVLDVEVTRVAGLRLLRALPVPGAPAGLVDEARQRLGLRGSRTLGIARQRIH